MGGHLTDLGVAVRLQKNNRHSERQQLGTGTTRQEDLANRLSVLPDCTFASYIGETSAVNTSSNLALEKGQRRILLQCYDLVWCSASCQICTFGTISPIFVGL